MNDDSGRRLTIIRSTGSRLEPSIIAEVADRMGGVS